MRLKSSMSHKKDRNLRSFLHIFISLQNDVI